MIRTLIVEDDPMVSEFNKRFLQKISGFELRGICSQAYEAEEVLNSETIDLVLLDIHMPGMNGWDLLKKIRSTNSECDVIIITASHDRESIQKGIRLGAVDYLIKPFEFDRFKEALITYYETRKEILSIHQWKQDEVDRQFKSKTSIASEQSNSDFPKGLTEVTMKRIAESLLLQEEQAFTTEEFAEIIGLSRVSVRKYLNYLVDMHVISESMNYHKVGRPVSTFKVINRERVKKLI
ncbi:response regulator [Salisediminibacterium beveridgei]|uniref:Transcriptional regulatory protein MalR n=1 Tax=Salisediminibacterium beveridgei TaxID=632773 RepID=A0A1D7QX35_9BACI|nr:response regulator [Salisediminibacterium beveridgei]AOM83566.1 transcriptional regulatory protein MalR [Salisediminibacterium beveridgei]